MEISLPKEIAFSPSLPSLPECTSFEVVTTPINGSKFGPGNMPIFDLLSRGYIDPTSFYIRYKLELTSTAASTIKGCPAYACFNKLETLIGSTAYETVPNYNQVCNMWVNLQMDVAMKYGLQSAYGWSTTNGTPSIEELDGRSCTAGEKINFAVPLPCLLSNCEKMVPIGMMPLVRIQITLAQISEAFGATGAPTGYEITNCELCYTVIDFAGGVNDIVKNNMGEKFYIKTSSFTTSTVPFSGSGSTDLIYNMRLASIKSLFANFTSSDSAKCINGIFDSIDPTSSNGTLQYMIAGNYYPTQAISTVNNKPSVLMELKKAVGALHSDNYNFSINSLEFNRTDAAATTLTAPGKFYFGVNTEKLSTNGALLTGISTQNSPISLRITTGTAPSAAINVTLIALYDALLEIDPINRQCVVKQ